MPEHPTGHPLGLPGTWEYDPADPEHPYRILDETDSNEYTAAKELGDNARAARAAEEQQQSPQQGGSWGGGRGFGN